LRTSLCRELLELLAGALAVLRFLDGIRPEMEGAAHQAGNYTKSRKHVWTSFILSHITRRYHLISGCSTYLQMARLPLQDSLGRCKCTVVNFDVFSSSGGVFQALCIEVATG